MRLNWEDPRFVVIVVALAIFIAGIYISNVISGFTFQLAIAFILGSLILIVILINTDAGLMVLIFSMLLSPEIILGQVPGRDVIIRFDDILLAVITLTWFAKTAINKGLDLFIKTPLNKAIGVYVLICLIATLRGIALGYVVPAKGFFYILRYIEYFILYLLVVNHIHSRKQIKFFLTAFFAICAFVSIYGILQIPIGVRVSAPFEGEVGEPNTFGGYLLFIFCIATGLFLQKVRPRIKVTLVGLAVLIFIPFLYTLSRASYLGVIFSFLAFVLLSKRKIVLITVMVAVAILIVSLRPEAVFSRVEYTFVDTFLGTEPELVKIGNITLDASASARIISWQYGFLAWKTYPFLGRGVTGFGFIDGQYVRTLTELGSIGFLILLWLLWLIFKHSIRIYKQMDDEFYRGLTLGFIAGFIGLAIHALTANTFIIIRIMEPFWFLAGIIMMLPAVREEEIAEEIKKAKEEEEKKKEEEKKGEEEEEDWGPYF